METSGSAWTHSATVIGDFGVGGLQESEFPGGVRPGEPEPPLTEDGLRKSNAAKSNFCNDFVDSVTEKLFWF